MTIKIPTLSYHRSYYDDMFKILEDINHWEHLVDVTFDFSECEFLAHNAVAFLGGLARLIKYRSGKVTFAWDTLRPEIMRNLARNEFLLAFDYPEINSVGNSIPYREDETKNKDGLVKYLRELWLGRGWVRVSSELNDAIVGRVWEIYENAFEHSRSPVGIFSCGQHYPRRQELKLTVVDFGVGIPSNVRNFIGNPDIPARNALKWAFQKGTSTTPNGTGRGIGLDLLKEFVSLAKGKLQIFSNEAYGLIEENQENYLKLENSFQGTLIDISLHCYEKLYYCFLHEIPERPPLQKGE